MGANEDEIMDSDELDNLADRIEELDRWAWARYTRKDDVEDPKPGGPRVKKSLELLKRTCTACGRSGGSMASTWKV